MDPLSPAIVTAQSPGRAATPLRRRAARGCGGRRACRMAAHFACAVPLADAAEVCADEFVLGTP